MAAKGAPIGSNSLLRTDPSVLKIEDIEVPPPASGEVQIEVKSIGLNRAEMMFRTHAYVHEAHFPSGLGHEAAGIVKNDDALSKLRKRRKKQTPSRDKARKLQ